MSTNATAPSAPPSPTMTDGNKLRRTVTNDGVLYHGDGRSYGIEPSSTGGRLTLSIEVEGSATPRVESLSVTSPTRRRELAERLAGDLHQELAALYERDFHQIVQEESEARNRQAGGSSQDERHALTARFDSLIDLVHDKGQVAFLVPSRTQKVETVLEITLPPPSFSPSGLWVPPRADQLPFKVPSYDQVRSALSTEPRKVWDHVVEWISSCSIPEDGYLDLEASYVFHTHVADRCIHSPIIALVGPPEHGKTRQGKAMLYVARRGVWTETPREAHLLRYATVYDATLFLDLHDGWASILRAGVEDIVLHRFERGAKVPRVIEYEAGPFSDTMFYEVYGPTVLASNVGLPVVLTSRCLPIPMRQSLSKPSHYPLEEDALAIRGELIAWRANTFGMPLPAVSSDLTGRLLDIAQPLLQVTQAVAPDRMSAVLAALEDMRDQKYQRNAETQEGRVVTALTTLRGKVENGLLPVGAVRTKANEGYRQNQWLTERQVSDVLRSLGFKPKPYGHERRSHVIYDDGLVKNLAASLLGLAEALS